MPLDEFELVPTQSELALHQAKMGNTISTAGDVLNQDAGIIPELQNKMRGFIEQNLHQENFAKFNDVHDVPGFIESAAHTFTETSPIWNTFKNVGQSVEHLTHMADVVEDGWTPFTMDAIEGIDDHYVNYVTDATSPKEQQARRDFILDKQLSEEYYQNGSLLGNLVGGALGYFASPETILLPVSSMIRYVNFEQNIVKNVSKIAPELALQSAAHNAWNESVKLGGNYQDFALQTSIDTTMGLAFTALGSGYAGLVTGGKLYDANKALKLLGHDGVKAVFKIDDKGVFKGLEAESLYGEGSAQRVDVANEFLHSRMAVDGLFKLIPGVGTPTGMLSPLVRMLNSPFGVVNWFANHLYDHDIVTVGTELGIPKPKALNVIIEQLFNRAKIFGWELEGIRKEANQIGGKELEDKSRVNYDKAAQEGKLFSKEAFGAAVAQVLRTGQEHSNKAINNAAARVHEHLKETLGFYNEANGLSPDVFTPRTAFDYLMRNYDRNAVRQNKQKWIDLHTRVWNSQDENILSLTQPITDMRDNIKSMEDYMLSKHNFREFEIEEQKSDLKKAKITLNNMIDELNLKIQDDPSLHILLTERNFMTSSDRARAKALQKPLRDKEKEIDEAKKLWSQSKKELAENKSSALNSKNSVEREKLNAIYEESTLKAQEIFEEVNKLEHELTKLKDDLIEQARNGEIDSKLFYLENENPVLRDPYEMPKLRKVFEDDAERQLAAEDIRQAILNETDEDIAAQVLNQFFPSDKEAPLKNRNNMIPDIELQNDSFLSNDLSKNIATYDMTLGRKTAWAQKFGKDGMEFILEKLKAQKENMERILEDKKLSEDDRLKEQAKIDKQYKTALSDVGNAYKYSMNKAQRSLSTRRFLHGMRAFTVATRLGGMVLTFMTDLGGIFLKNNFMDVVHGGLLPMGKTINGLVGGEAGMAYRESALAIGMATEHMLSLYQDHFWNKTTSDPGSFGSIIGDGLSQLAHLSGNLSGATFVDNAFQHLAANVVQHRVMRCMFQYKAGILPNKDKIFLARHGMDPALWSERFINAYDKHGESNKSGGLYSNYWRWDDSEAKLNMATAIQQGVRDSILKAGGGSTPFWAQDPIWSIATFLKGWALSAFTRYTVPLMQKPDRDKALGMGVMLVLGSLTDPMRKWSRGEEYDFSNKEKFILDAINNSGVFGVVTDLLQDANALMGNPFLNNMKSDRYAERTIPGILAGPIGGIATDLGKVLGMFTEGKLNEAEFKKFVRLIPLTQIWYLRKLSNALVEGMGLPKTRHAARKASRLLNEVSNEGQE